MILINFNGWLEVKKEAIEFKDKEGQTIDTTGRTDEEIVDMISAGSAEMVDFTSALLNANDSSVNCTFDEAID